MKENVSCSSNTVTDSLKKVSTKSSTKISPTNPTYPSLSLEDSAFRRAFKFYKKRSEDIDLSNVLDLRVSNEFLGISCVPFPSNNTILTDSKLNPISDWSLTTLAARPGLYVVNNVISPRGQLELMERCLLDYPEPPNVTNLMVDGSYREANVFLKRGEKLRWVTMGNDYDWTNKVYAENARSPLPEELVKLAALISDALGLGTMDADAVILNFYPNKATLSPHVDRSERSITKPLISVSLGQSAIYLTGGVSLNDPVDALLLQSGDILVMHAAQRLVYHAVPRILKTHNFDEHLTDGIHPKVVEYAQNSRVNITIRQVD